MRSRIAVVALLAPLFLCTRSLVGQSADSSATVAGRVVDADGKVVPYVANPLGTRGAHPNTAGFYRVDRLPTGTNSAHAPAIGFANRMTTLTLERDTTTRPPTSFNDELRPVTQDSGVATVDAKVPGRVLPPYERFGARLLVLLAQKRGLAENTVVSPLSAGLALALAAGGARDATYRALMVALGGDSLDATGLARRDSLLLLSLSARQDVTLEVANALWMSPKYTIQPTYTAKAATAYNSRVTSVALNGQSGIDTINAWVKDRTHGKIASILEKPLPDTTSLVITNAVYFHGLWLEAFDLARTRPLAFHTQPGRTDSVPGMERTAYLAYLRGDGMQAIRLPYRGNKAALFVILPDSGVRLDALEARFARDGWPLLSREPHEVHLRLPRVHAEATLDLVPQLMTLGASIAFDCKRANFRAMLVLHAGENACIGEVTQKTFVDIDEKGTEAAAVTSVGMLAATGYTPTIEFIVDRPFLFVLRDEVSGAALFIGRIVSP